LRHASASGGVVSTLIYELIAAGKYDGAFCLDSYDYRQQLKTRLYTAEEVASSWNQSNAPKSRYLPVSHEDAVSYMKQNREARLILVAAPCALRGLLAAIDRLKLKRENYLLIGLFCDKVFNYNCMSYFGDTYAGGAELEALHFKNKESGGWPGDMKFFPVGQDPFYVPLNDRAKAKAYFMPERCLYCVDKLNACADISLGDNYTDRDESELGSNSVIIRTEWGVDAWNMAKDSLEIRDIGIAHIQNAQVIERRLDNMYCGDLRHPEIDLNPGMPREKETVAFVKAWKIALLKLKAGAVYNANPDVLIRQIRKDNKKTNPVIQFVKRGIGYIKRKLK
jgi:coenzyme F420-reducing hydrogenase beta subunit